MNDTEEQIEFDSGTGWGFGSLSFRPEFGTTAELMLDGSNNRKLYVELRGVRSPGSLLEVLHGFDDFRILQRDTGTPCSEFARFLCRFYLDDETYETVIDEYEAHDSNPEQANATRT